MESKKLDKLFSTVGKSFLRIGDWMAERVLRHTGDKRKAKKVRQSIVASHRILILFSAIIFATIVLSINLSPREVSSLNVGEIASDDIYYNGSPTTFISDVLTESARNEAAESVDNVYVIDETIEQNLLLYVDECFAAVSAAASQRESGGTYDYEALAEELPGTYSRSILNFMTSLDSEELITVRDTFKGILSTIYQSGVTNSELENLKNDLASAVASSTIVGNSEAFIKTMIEGMTFSYNESYDANGTAEAIAQAMDGVASVQVTVRSGEKLVSRGSVVTAEQIETLERLGLISGGSNVLSYLGVLLAVSMIYVLIWLYLKFFRPQIYDKPLSLVLLFFIISLVLLLCKILSLININDNSAVSLLIGYMMPAAVAPMLISVLLGREAALCAAVSLAVFIGMMMNGEISYSIVALLSGFASVISTAHLSQRSQFVRASAIIMGVNIVVITGLGLIWNSGATAIGVGLVFGLLNGLLSAILVIGLLPFLESGFGVTTVIRLLELSNSNHPLLKRLMMEAPGTYNHCILVGNLAEAAADAIGAKTLLVRVAAYYHDIGKLKRPHFFVENQTPGENPHDKLQPILSAMIITSHVTDGGKMLRDYKFPEEIIDIVEQHHGNGLLSLFYNKALQAADDEDKVREEDFRYKCRCPQTREAGLVMLADSVQAAVQSVKQPVKGEIEQLVHEVIQRRITEGQLKACPLTFRDLEKIEQSFLMVLSGMNHHRISYPDNNSLQEAANANKSDDKN